MIVAIIGLLGTAVGSLGLYLLQRWFQRGDRKKEEAVELRIAEMDAATQIREELREEIRELRVKVDALQSELDESRSRHYSLRGQYNDLEIKYSILLRQIHILHRTIGGEGEDKEWLDTLLEYVKDTSN